MSRQPDKPTTDDRDSSTASGPKQSDRLSRQQARFRLWQAKADQATRGEKVNGVGQPRRRPAPSLPKLPWND